jgi:hypothetical protein
MPTGFYKRTPERIKELKKSGFQKGYTPWNKELKNWQSTEHKEKIRLVHLGKKASLETKLKQSLVKKGKKTGPMSEEHKRRISDSHKGEKCYRYIKDRSLLKVDERLKSYDTQYKYWMLEVKKRDGWKCKINNCDCRGRLEAHHILDWKNYPELRYNINNGITLCHAHHPRKRAEEKRLIPFLQELVSVSN